MRVNIEFWEQHPDWDDTAVVEVVIDLEET